MRWVVSAKAVVLDDERGVLLGLNSRNEWELPGGQPEPGEAPDAAVRREVREETGLQVDPVGLVRAWVVQPIPNAEVLIISYGCLIVGGDLSVSDEHEAMRFHPMHLLDQLVLPDGYRRDISMWAELR